MLGPMRAALVIGVAALAACAPRALPEGQYFGLVAKREAVEVEADPSRGATAEVSQVYAWTVKLDGGRWMTVVQNAPMFAIGERVKVITGDGPARIQIP